RRRALSTSSRVGLSLLATHGRPSIMITLSAPSCATTQVPTIGSNVAGGLPTTSFERSTFVSAARTTVTSRSAVATNDHRPAPNDQRPTPPEGFIHLLRFTKNAPARTSAGHIP